jgi:hypothetical protein
VAAGPPAVDLLLAGKRGAVHPAPPPLFFAIHSSAAVFFVGVQHPNVSQLLSLWLLLLAARVDRRCGGGGGGSKDGELTALVALVTGGGSGEAVEEARLYLVLSEEREEGVQERDPVRERVIRLAVSTATDPEREEDLLAVAAEQAQIVTCFFRRVVPVISGSSSSSSEEGSGVMGEDTPAQFNIF